MTTPQQVTEPRDEEMELMAEWVCAPSEQEADKAWEALKLYRLSRGKLSPMEPLWKEKRREAG